MGRKVLIVSPHFPPINAPDYQRVRMALRHFKELGWDPTVLAIAPEFSENGRDESLLATIPHDIEIHRVRALSAVATRTIGLGNLALRSLPYLRAEGNRLLSSRHYDLVFFSTSVFPVMALGPFWQRRFGTPYVLDFQDPWLTDFYKEKNCPPPGGRLRYALSNMLGYILEPRVVRKAAHMVVVSPMYPDLLQSRYPSLKEKNFTVLPFCASEHDMEFARSAPRTHNIFECGDGLVHWVYAGIAGRLMQKSIRCFLIALKEKFQDDPKLRERLRIHFVGTDYGNTQQEKPFVSAVAAELGLADVVDERTKRLPFLSTLQLLEDADALLIFGSDDPSYSASKIFPYIMARKPLLVIVHENSLVAEIVRKTRGGKLITFNGHDDEAETIARLSKDWFGKEQILVETNWQEFEQYTAPAMTASLCSLFSRIVSRTNGVNT